MLGESIILTYNWDTIIETLLDRNCQPYVFDFNSAFDTKAIPIIKMHGSIDWFSNLYPEKMKDWMEFTSLGEHIEGHHRARGNLLQYYNNYMSPKIVIPSYDKINQVMTLGNVWKYPWKYLQDKLEVIIIGFSMRADDYHSGAFIYPQLVQGTRNGDLKVKVIDFANNNEEKNEIRERYKGVENCEFWFDGFCEEACDFIKKPTEVEKSI